MDRGNNVDSTKIADSQDHNIQSKFDSNSQNLFQTTQVGQAPQS